MLLPSHTLALSLKWMWRSQAGNSQQTLCVAVFFSTLLKCVAIKKWEPCMIYIKLHFWIVYNLSMAGQQTVFFRVQSLLRLHCNITFHGLSQYVRCFFFSFQTFLLLIQNPYSTSSGLETSTSHRCELPEVVEGIIGYVTANLHSSESLQYDEPRRWFIMLMKNEHDCWH